MWFVRPMLAQIVGRLYRSPTCPHPFFLLATWLLLIHITLCFFLLLSPCKVDSWRLPCASHLEEGHASHALSHWYIYIFFLCCNMRFSIGHLCCCYFDSFLFVLWCVTFVISWCCGCDIVTLQLLIFRCCIIFILAIFVSSWGVFWRQKTMGKIARVRKFSLIFIMRCYRSFFYLLHQYFFYSFQW
jgi:hypothetical protein